VLPESRPRRLTRLTAKYPSSSKSPVCDGGRIEPRKDTPGKKAGSHTLSPAWREPVEVEDSRVHPGCTLETLVVDLENASKRLRFLRICRKNSAAWPFDHGGRSCQHDCRETSCSDRLPRRGCGAVEAARRVAGGLLRKGYVSWAAPRGGRRLRTTIEFLRTPNDGSQLEFQSIYTFSSASVSLKTYGHCIHRARARVPVGRPMGGHASRGSEHLPSISRAKGEEPYLVPTVRITNGSGAFMALTRHVSGNPGG